MLGDGISTANGDAVRAAALQRLDEWMGMARGAYAANTLRAWLHFAMATVRRMRSLMSRVHVAAGYAAPGQAEAVRLALREGGRQIGTRQAQARGLVWDEIALYLERPAVTLRDLRDRALVCVAYHGWLQPEELGDIDVEHLAFDEDGPGTLLIPVTQMARARSSRWCRAP